MNNVLKSAIVILLVSAALVVWGASYRPPQGTNVMDARFDGISLFHALAAWTLVLGVVAYLVGVVLMIAGILRISSTE
ncbi:MAG TPA: hypothetical protein VMH83_02190 [Candidatus Acidoferrum sp.]|nr:hypothetical protein [Candidatus Acidoferrum sp.]